MRLCKGVHLKNNQGDMNNGFHSRYVFHANAFDKFKYYDYHSVDHKKEFSSFQNKPERIVSVQMKYIYLEKYSAIFHYYIVIRKLIVVISNVSCVCIRVLGI